MLGGTWKHGPQNVVCGSRNPEIKGGNIKQSFDSCSLQEKLFYLTLSVEVSLWVQMEGMDKSWSFMSVLFMARLWNSHFWSGLTQRPF